MDLTKLYLDSDGDECNILEMLKRDPEWAANRLQAGEEAIENCKTNVYKKEKLINAGQGYYLDPMITPQERVQPEEDIYIEKCISCGEQFIRENSSNKCTKCATETGLSTLREKVREKLLAIRRQKEFIIEAFIAETGCKPSECEQIQRIHKDGSISWHIQKREK